MPAESGPRTGREAVPIGITLMSIPVVIKIPESSPDPRFALSHVMQTVERQESFYRLLSRSCTQRNRERVMPSVSRPDFSELDKTRRRRHDENQRCQGESTLSRAEPTAGPPGRIPRCHLPSPE